MPLLRVPLIGERALLEQREDGRLAIVRRADGVVAGHVLLERREAALFVRELVVDSAYRGYGLGSDTARLLREAASDAGFAVLRGWAPPHLGLAVYFWSRMGLHPVFGDGPGGGISFERVLAPPASPAATGTSRS